MPHSTIAVFTIADYKPKQRGSRYFSGFVVLCVLVGFVAVQAWPKLSTELKSSVIESVSSSLGRYR